MATNNTFKVRLTGTRPLLMSSAAGVMPRGEIGDRLRELNAKKKLTDADREERARLKYFVALYHDQMGVYVPGHNVWACGKAGAKMHKLGEKWKQGVMVLEDRLPLIYEGPKTPEALYADSRFVDVRVAVLNGKARIEAVRPIFPKWSLEATFTVDDEFINMTDVKRALTLAGPALGLGTYRERFGRFTTEFVEALRKAA